jgi:D-sedoheptulose 7-phosphate isomerase
MNFEESLAESLQTLNALATVRPAIDQASRLILETLDRGGKLLIGGNGGSAAEAMHFAAELTGRYLKKRRSLPAIALSGDGAVLTCIGNDFGFEDAFARQIAGLAGPRDLVVLISTSGNSGNIVAALGESKKMKVSTVALLGKGGGRAKGLASCEIIVPGQSVAAAQEAHLFLIHHFCELIDEKFAG